MRVAAHRSPRYASALANRTPSSRGVSRRLRAWPIGGSVALVTGFRTAATSMADLLRDLQASESRGSAYSRDRPGSFCLVNWPDASARNAGTRSASYIQVGSGTGSPAPLSLDCHFFIEHVHEKIVELREFETLTSCMPCRPDPSPDGARRRPACRSPAKTLARCGLVSPGSCRRWLPSWLPANSLAALTSHNSNKKPTRQAARAAPFADPGRRSHGCRSAIR